MEFKKIERNKRTKIIICFVFLVLLLFTIILMVSKAKYQVTKSVSIVNGNISYSPYDFTIVEIRKENDDGRYEITTSVPTTGYEIDENKSKCMIDDTQEDEEAILKTIDGNHTFSNLKKRDKCTLYFKKEKHTAEDTLVNLGIESDGILTANITGPSCSGNKGGICYDSGSQNNNMAENGVYSVEDDFGTSYVFRGTLDDNKNNWVKFGQENGKDIWWRIIRINGNGTIRLIYAGTNTAGGTTAPATTGTGTQITTTYTNDKTVQQYNATYNDNTYVGFMNNGGSTSKYADAHQNSKDSTIKGELDKWWTNTNLGSQGIVEKIDIDTGFCNDRELADKNHGSYLGKGNGGYAKRQTAYAPVHRVWNSDTSEDKTQEPTLKCSNPTRDLFTGQNSKGATTKDGTTILGNKKLTNPVGLITSDEVIFAGGFAGQSNNKYWLCTNKDYWTMSPYYFDSNGYAYVFRVDSYGYLYTNSVYGARGVRPVINLKADITFTGTGASNNPYKIS